MNYKIIDNALPQNSFIELQEIFFSNNFSWFYRDQTTDNVKDDSFYLTHSLFDRYQINSDHFIYVNSLFTPLLNIKSLNIIRANLTFNLNKEIYADWHTDNDPYSLYDGSIVNFKTAIFYLNTNNGSTYLQEENSLEIEAVANRLLVFDGGIRHSNKFSTNTKRRIVLNFNYA